MKAAPFRNAALLFQNERAIPRTRDDNELFAQAIALFHFRAPPLTTVHQPSEELGLAGLIIEEANDVERAVFFAINFRRTELVRDAGSIFTETHASALNVDDCTLSHEPAP